MLQCGCFLTNNARNVPSRAAIITGERTLTYRELDTESALLAGALRRRGIARGDRVALLMKNCAEWAVVWYACQKLGAVLVPLHSRLGAEELVREVGLVGGAALIYGGELREAAAAIRDGCPGLWLLVGLGAEPLAGSEAWDALLDGAEPCAADCETADGDPALILFTSGTTALPKGVVRTQAAAALHGMTLALAGGGMDAEAMLTTAPLYHTGGLLCLLKMAILGGTLILPERFDAAEVAAMIGRCRVTQLMLLPPVVYEWLYQSRAWERHDLSSVREVCISAGKCTMEYAMHIFEMFPNCRLRPSWGSTETCSVTGMLLSREELVRDPGLIRSVGRPNALTEVRIVDERGVEVADGEAGEAQVRSPMLLAGYAGPGGGTESALDADGWFRTGDLMRLDPVSRCYYFLDRKKDMIKTGGENVYAPEVERVIQTHPAVAECAVVAVPDPRFGEAVGAAVVLKPGASLTGAELTEFCRARLPSYQKPRYLAVLERLPVNDVGKVQKALLRRDAARLFAPIFGSVRDCGAEVGDKAADGGSGLPAGAGDDADFPAERGIERNHSDAVGADAAIGIGQKRDAEPRADQRQQGGTVCA